MEHADFDRLFPGNDDRAVLASRFTGFNQDLPVLTCSDEKRQI
jgi:hypothetical protein